MDECSFIFDLPTHGQGPSLLDKGPVTLLVILVFTTNWFDLIFNFSFSYKLKALGVAQDLIIVMMITHT